MTEPDAITRRCLAYGAKLGPRGTPPSQDLKAGEGKSPLGCRTNIGGHASKKKHCSINFPYNISNSGPHEQDLPVTGRHTEVCAHTHTHLTETTQTVKVNAEIQSQSCRERNTSRHVKRCTHVQTQEHHNYYQLKSTTTQYSGHNTATSLLTSALFVLSAYRKLLPEIANRAHRRNFRERETRCGAETQFYCPPVIRHYSRVEENRVAGRHRPVCARGRMHLHTPEVERGVPEGVGCFAQVRLNTPRAGGLNRQPSDRQTAAYCRGHGALQCVSSASL